MNSLDYETPDEHVKLLRDLCFYEKRLKTFTNWPFSNKANCTIEKMASAGFFHPPDTNLDVAQCCFCFKELEGWEPDDEPMSEHKKHSSKCPFLTSKPVENMNAQEGIQMELQRYVGYLTWYKNHMQKMIGIKLDEVLDPIQDELAAKFSRRRQPTIARSKRMVSETSDYSMISNRSTRSTRSKR